MTHRSTFTKVLWGLAAVAGVAAGAYAAAAARTYTRYGRPRPPSGPEEEDDALDALMPSYDVVERHRIAVDAPASVTFDAARAVDFTRTAVARAIFRTRALVMGAAADERPASRGFVDDMQALGWGVLAEVADREIVMGGVTKPWEANPVFRALPPEEFVRFSEPDFVKIAFTLRADATGEATSVFRTETRAVAIDHAARAKFRRYWALLSPGIFLIRAAALGPVKKEAERRARRARHSSEQSSTAIRSVAG